MQTNNLNYLIGVLYWGNIRYNIINILLLGELVIMNKLEVKNMDISIDLEGGITTIIGPSNSGKTYLAKKLCNKVDNRDVFIDGEGINKYDIKFLRENIVVVLDDNNFNTEYVLDEFCYYLRKISMDSRADDYIKDIVDKFKIKKLLDRRIDSLYLSDKILIKILSLLALKPKIMVIDNLLIYLDKQEKELLIKYVRELEINLINLTTNSEELFISDTIIVLNNFKAMLTSTPSVILDGNSILPYMGLKLPFIVDLSHNLILYNVIDKIYFENKKLVDKLWK